MWPTYMSCCDRLPEHCNCEEQEPLRCESCREALPEGEAVELEEALFCRSCANEEIEASREEVTHVESR